MTQSPQLNIVVLRGTLSSAPTLRSLPSGSTLATFEVTTRDDRGTATVPVVWFDPDRVPDSGAGDEVVVAGQVRRRFFRAGGATASRTEVVASAVVPATRRAAARRLVQRALAPAG